MKHKSRINVFGATNSLKVLSYLVQHPGKEFMASEIQLVTNISRAGVYLSLNELIKQNLVSKTRKGKFLFYSMIFNDSAIKQFKILQNVLSLRPLVSKLESSAKKIVLYGSLGRGENAPDSDIDIFVVSNNPSHIKELLSSFKTNQKIQAVIKSPSEISEFKEKEKVFYTEVDRGIVLWEERA